MNQLFISALTIEDGLTDVPYDGIVDGYFNVDKMSAMLREKYERYKMLVRKIRKTLKPGWLPGLWKKYLIWEIQGCVYTKVKCV